MVPRPTSDELWGSHSMLSPCQFDVLMPNGIMINIELNRDINLGVVKEKLWSKAKNEVLFRLLRDPHSYIFKGVTSWDGKSEEFYDEQKCLCDLNLFQAFLALVEIAGDLNEKIYNCQLSDAIGKAVGDFDSIKDPEFNQCRYNLLTLAQDHFERRKTDPSNQKLEYFYPAEVEAHQPLSNDDNSPTTRKEYSILVYNGDKSKSELFSVKSATTPNKLLEVVKNTFACTDKMYVLKVCAFDEYIMGNIPLNQFKVRNLDISTYFNCPSFD